MLYRYLPKLLMISITSRSIYYRQVYKTFPRYFKSDANVFFTFFSKVFTCSVPYNLLDCQVDILCMARRHFTASIIPLSVTLEFYLLCSCNSLAGIRLCIFFNDRYTNIISRHYGKTREIMDAKCFILGILHVCIWPIKFLAPK